MRRFIQRMCLIVFMAACLPASLPVWGQQNPQRLVLKDGSYQTVTKWEIKGDRVRYYSAERYLWEELPKELVDWPSTEKYNQERQSRRAEVAGQLAREESADREAEDMHSPQIAPGLRLPDQGGVFLLDDFHTEVQLVELVQNNGELNKQMGKNILRAAINPLALSSKQTVELKGDHAPVQAHVPQPVIFVNVTPTDDIADAVANNRQGKDSPIPAERYRIVRLQTKKNNRVVGNLKIGITGRVSEKENWIRTTSTQVGDWAKITPAEPLEPGEYALVEMLDKTQVNLYVWDFGFNPDAAANPSAWTPSNPAPQQNTAPPSLGKRPPN